MANWPFWIIAILMLGILILVHELGHYLVGRLFKFKIKEFSIGMGPKIFSRVSKKTDIRYSLRGIPLGGFVSFLGEDEDKEDPQAMNNMPWYSRALLFFAGAGFNIIFAFLLIAILITSVGYNGAKIEKIDSRSSLYEVAMPGDVVYAVDGKQMVDVNHFKNVVSDTDEFELTVIRNGEKVNYICNKVEIDGEQKLGISYSAAQIKQNFFQSLSYSFKYNVYMTKTMYSTLWQLVRGELGTEALSGPISTIGAIGGIVKDTSEYGENTADKVRIAVLAITELLSIISLNLAVMNLLPLPALDGFRLISALFEGVTKKHIPRKIEGIINTAGLLIIIGLMLLLELSKLF